MDCAIVRMFDGKKFLWDGAVYDDVGKAAETEESYKKENFETRTVKEQEKHLLYTRRVAAQSVAEGEKNTGGV